MIRTKVKLLLLRGSNLRSNCFVQWRSLSRQSTRGTGSKLAAPSVRSKVEKLSIKYEDNPGFDKLLKPFGFACLVTGLSFGGCAIWQYEHKRQLHTRARLQRRPPYNQNISPIAKVLEDLGRFSRTIVYVIGANCAVCVLWRVNSVVVRQFMLKWFTANPASTARCLPMVLSTFSHTSFLHLAINMYVLWSFSGGIKHSLGTEEFLAFYLSAGVWSSFFSHAVKIATKSFKPSVGASGAIMAVVAATATLYPDSQVGIIFLPFSFPAGMALKCLIGFETCGVLFRWKFLDHAAHLSGLLCGWYYVTDGKNRLWRNREPFVRKWHDMRGNPGSKK